MHSEHRKFPQETRSRVRTFTVEMSQMVCDGQYAAEESFEKRMLR